MDKDDEFTFEYFSPATVQAGLHDFHLHYKDAEGTVEFSGLLKEHPSGGMLYFLSPEHWDVQYPSRKGQRELIKARLLAYCKSRLYFQFLEPSIRHDALYRRFPPSVAAFLAGAGTSPFAALIGSDLGRAMVISLLWPLAVLTGEDPLNIGLWYYLFLPALAFYVGARLHAPSLYLTGASLAIATSLLFFTTLGRPADLPGMRHLVSLPGAFIGYVGCLVLAQRNPGALAVLALGFFGWWGGLVVSQRFVCKLNLWC